jgi:hypothetical protein
MHNMLLAAMQAGMFLWMALGAGVTDADEILDLLAEHRVVVVPGELRCMLCAPQPLLMLQPCGWAWLPHDRMRQTHLLSGMFGRSHSCRGA